MSVPLYQKVFHLTLSAALGAIASTSTMADSIDGRSLPETIEKQSAPTRKRDRLVQRIFREPHLLQDVIGTENGMRPEHLVALTTSRGLRLFVWGLGTLLGEHTWPDATVSLRRMHLDELVRESPVLPTFSGPLQLLEYIVNNVDLLDVLHPVDDTSCVELRTTFLDQIPTKNGDHCCGGIVRLQVLSQDPSKFRIATVTHEGRTYNSKTVPPTVVDRVLWGLLAYVTGCTHLGHLHVRQGVLLPRLSQRLLPMSHPLRQVLAPTEVGTASGVARSIPSLLARDGVFVNVFPFTYEGWQRLLADYRPNTRRTWVETAPNLPIVGDYGRWWSYCREHMHKVLITLYPTDQALTRDTAVLQWIREAAALLLPPSDRTQTPREQLTILLAHAFFSQVRHNFLSNERVSHIVRWYYILHPGATDVIQAMRLMVVTTATKIRWVPLAGRGFEHTVRHSAISKVMGEFYDGLAPHGKLARSMLHVMALPSEIEASIGI